jgi:hypothetical protein
MGKSKVPTNFFALSSSFSVPGRTFGTSPLGSGVGCSNMFVRKSSDSDRRRTLGPVPHRDPRLAPQASSGPQDSD